MPSIVVPAQLHNSAPRDLVPETFESLFENYYGYVVNLVAKLGIDWQNSEDVAMSVLTKFYEKDALSDFNPEYTSEYDGITRKAVFRTFLSGFVKTYTMHHRTTQTKRFVREGFSTDTPWASPSGTDQTWLEVNGPSVEDDHNEFETLDQVNLIRERLKQELPRNSQDRADMLRLFDMMLDHYYETGVVSPTRIAVEFGVSKNSVQTWIKRLRPLVAEVLDLP